MSFSAAIRSCFQKYSTFRGVAVRSEYWYFVLFNFIISLIFNLTDLAVLRIIWALVAILPNLAVTTRRLHDQGKSAWWWFTVLVPFWLLILMCFPSKLTNNPYAPDRTSAVSSPNVTEAHVATSSAHCSVCGKLRLPGQAYCMGCGTKLSD